MYDILTRVLCFEKKQVLDIAHYRKIMATKPPYTITEKAADYLAKIVEIITKLEYATDFKRNIRLHRLNRVRTIYSSLAIEGNSLSKDAALQKCTKPCRVRKFFLQLI